jgi:predicted DNA-binding helix-hairpin-helix protein
MVALNARIAERMDSTARDALYRRMWIPLDLDRASREEILLIPGVGPRMAHEFEEYRPYDGGMAEFRREIGKYVDDAEVDRLARYVTVR